MDDEAPRLRRRLFGFSQESIRHVLEDREARFARATEELNTTAERARLAEDRAATAEQTMREAELGREDAERTLAETAQRTSDAERRIEIAEARVRAAEARTLAAQERARAAEDRARAAETALREAPAPKTEPPTAPGPMGGGALASVLSATEEAVTRLFEDAKRRAEQQVEDAERRRGEVEAETQRLGVWWARIDPLVSDVRTSIDDARDEVGMLSDRIGSVLEPVTKAFASLGSRLTELAEAAAPLETATGGATDPPTVVVDLAGTEEAGEEGTST
jgi:DNA repair exonuclease SbcCD ATPase subunit